MVAFNCCYSCWCLTINWSVSWIDGDGISIYMHHSMDGRNFFRRRRKFFHSLYSKSIGSFQAWLFPMQKGRKLKFFFHLLLWVDGGWRVTGKRSFSIYKNFIGFSLLPSAPLKMSTWKSKHEWKIIWILALQETRRNIWIDGKGRKKHCKQMFASYLH